MRTFVHKIELGNSHKSRIPYTYSIGWENALWSFLIMSFPTKHFIYVAISEVHFVATKQNIILSIILEK